jgi:hypothetical protein
MPQDLPVCQVASHAPSVFELGAPSGADAISVERVAGSTPGAEGTVRFVLRNESGKDLNTLCAVTVFRDEKEKPHAVRVSLAQAGQETGALTFEDGSACLTIQPAWKASPAEMRKLMNRKIVEQGGICPICHEEFTDYSDVVPDHKNPKGMGGAWRRSPRQYPSNTLVVQ